MDNKEIELLSNIYKESKKNQDTIGMLLSKVYDDDLSYDLNSQMNRYKSISYKAGKKLAENGVKIDNAPMEKMKSWSKIQANTIFNTSTEHIADMMIQSSTRSMVDMMNNVKDNYESKCMAVEMAQEFADFEENNIRILKSYL